MEQPSRVRGSKVGWQRGYVGTLFIWRGLVIGVVVFERRSGDSVFYMLRILGPEVGWQRGYVRILLH